MRSCSTQSHVLEHYLRLETNTPENWLSALQVLTRSPRLSVEFDLQTSSDRFSARLAFLETVSVNVCGLYFDSSCDIFGTSPDYPTIIMPIEGTIEFKVGAQHFFIAPGVPFVLDAGMNFFARHTSGVNVFIAQPRAFGSKPQKETLEGGDPKMTEILEDYLLKTPFFKDHTHAVTLTNRFGNALHDYMKGTVNESTAPKISKLITDERRLCRALELVNDHLKTGVNLEKISKDSGMSLRTFYYLLKKYTGLTPYIYCRARRLVKARESLIHAHNEDPIIANHALDWGFSHPGRFSAHYLQHFGEHPSETLDLLKALKKNVEKVKSTRACLPGKTKYWYTSTEAIPA